MLGSPEPRLNMPDVRLGDEVYVVVVRLVELLWRESLYEGEEERRLENIECFWGGAGGGLGSRLDPKRGMLLVGYKIYEKLQDNRQEIWTARCVLGWTLEMLKSGDLELKIRNAHAGSYM